MLDSNSRRPAFDRWFDSLDPVDQTVVVDAAMTQRQSIKDSGDLAGPVSLIDCLENIWDQVLEHGIETI